MTVIDKPDLGELGWGDKLNAALDVLVAAIDAETAARVAAVAGLIGKADPSSAFVATSQTIAVAAYGDLATVGPVVAVNIGASGKALIVVGCNMFHAAVNGICGMSFAVSGATVRAASDNESVQFTSSTVGAQVEASRVSLVTGLTAGLNTFTAKYYASGGTGTFRRRSLIVIPL